MRQTLFAALLLIPTAVRGEIIARFDPADGSVVMSGLERAQRQALEADPGILSLRRADASNDGSMLISVSIDGEIVRISPRFALRAGDAYHLALSLPDRQPFGARITLDAKQASVPVLTGFSPRHAEVPANALRFYLSFSEPMARGQVRDAIRLVQEDGRAVASPFLNLETELWDPSQRRLTLFMDPGRMKQGVGPNLRAGAPLEDGRRYRIIVASIMKSAEGVALGEDQSIAFGVGGAERRALDPERWWIKPPRGATLDPLVVEFDRLVDVGASSRMLAVVSRDGREIDGGVETDGKVWVLKPETPWSPGLYRLVIDPELEDVSGNTMRSEFDATAGTMGKRATAAALDFVIDPARTAAD